MNLSWLNPEWVGYVAAFCTTISFVPQVLLVIRTQDTQAISLGMYTIFTLGVSMWLVYGMYIKSVPMVIANIVTLLLALYILARKVQDTIAPEKAAKRRQKAAEPTS